MTIYDVFKCDLSPSVAIANFIEHKATSDTLANTVSNLVHIPHLHLVLLNPKVLEYILRDTRSTLHTCSTCLGYLLNTSYKYIQQHSTRAGQKYPNNIFPTEDSNSSKCFNIGFSSQNKYCKFQPTFLSNRPLQNKSSLRFPNLLSTDKGIACCCIQRVGSLCNSTVSPDCLFFIFLGKL